MTGERPGAVPAPDTSLNYIDSDGAPRTVKGCSLTVDKAGRYWLWSEKLEGNIAFKERSKEACLLSAINVLLFIVQLRDERIAKLEQVNTLARTFAQGLEKLDEDF